MLNSSTSLTSFFAVLLVAGAVTLGGCAQDTLTGPQTQAEENAPVATETSSDQGNNATSRTHGDDGSTDDPSAGHNH